MLSLMVLENAASKTDVANARTNFRCGNRPEDDPYRDLELNRLIREANARELTNRMGIPMNEGNVPVLEHSASGMSPVSMLPWDAFKVKYPKGRQDLADNIFDSPAWHATLIHQYAAKQITFKKRYAKSADAAGTNVRDSSETMTTTLQPNSRWNYVPEEWRKEIEMVWYGDKNAELPDLVTRFCRIMYYWFW